MRYNVLRYSHDVTTGEAVNIGIVIFLPTKTLFFKGDLRRAKALFPQMDYKCITKWLDALSKKIEKGGVTLRHTDDILPPVNYPLSTWFGELVMVALNLDVLPTDFEKKYIDRLVEKYLPNNLKDI